MKRFVILCSVAFVALGAWRLADNQTAITGKVTPVEGATMAWAISGRDSAAGNVVNGTFSVAVKPGLYRVIVDAVEPYKDAVLENISIKEGQTIDVGEIVLQK